MKVNYFTQSSCRMHPPAVALPSHPLAVPWVLRMCPTLFGKQLFQPQNISRLKNFLTTPPPPQIQFPSHQRALSIFSYIKGSIELTIIFFGFWVVGHVSLTSNRGGGPFPSPIFRIYARLRFSSRHSRRHTRNEHLGKFQTDSNRGPQDHQSNVLTTRL